MLSERTDHKWIRTLQPVGGLALALGLTVGAAAPAFAQATPPAGGQTVNLTGSPVSLHDGSCADPVLEPEFEIGALVAEPYAEVVDEWVTDALDEDVPADVRAPGVSPALISEDVDADGVLDADEDLDDDGVLDAGIDVDGDGVLGDDEPLLVSEDLDGDGVLDEGEDIDGDGVIDVALDDNRDGVLDEAELADFDAALLLIDRPTVWKAEEEVDASFEELFGVDEDGVEESEDDDAIDDPGVVAVHRSAEQFGDIVACGEMTAPLWEDESDVVVGIRPVGGSGVYGFAVFERDTGNVPIFGENTTGVTTYLFQNLSTARSERMMGQGAGQATQTPAAFDLPTEATVELGNAEFNPSELRVAAETDVELTLANLSTSPATFTIDELGIDERLEPGDTRTITLNAPAGTYEYYSAAEDDREAGMVGTLVVGQ